MFHRILLEFSRFSHQLPAVTRNYTLLLLCLIFFLNRPMITQILDSASRWTNSKIISLHIFTCAVFVVAVFNSINFKKKERERDFPGGLVAKTQRSRGRGPGFASWSGNENLHAPVKSSHTSNKNSHATTKTQHGQINIKRVCTHTVTPRKALINILRKNKYPWFPYIHVLATNASLSHLGRWYIFSQTDKHSNICCSWQLQVRFLTDHWFYVLIWEDADTEIPCFKYTFLYISI